VVALSGVVVYIQLGLSLPRWTLLDSTTIATPRSGGELPIVNGSSYSLEDGTPE
jgi:hypothetical protein